MERLAWFDAPTDVPHWVAWSALRRMAIDDEPLSQQIASLEWVIDGITAEEAGALDDLSWLLRENPDIADTALKLPWMATNGDITPDDRRALRAVRGAADADAEFGAELAAYGWLPDGATTDEADALETPRRNRCSRIHHPDRYRHRRDANRPLRRWCTAIDLSRKA